MRADWPLPLLRLGETAMQGGLYAEALSAFDRALAIAPGDGKAINGAGISLDLLGRHGEAQERYMSGMEKAPDNLALRNNLGLSLALSGDFDKAVALLQGAATDPAAGVRTRNNLALVYGLSGDDAKARTVSSADLNDAEITNNLAFYARLRGMDADGRRKAVFGVIR